MTGPVIRLAGPDAARRVAEVHVAARRAAYAGLIPEEQLAAERPARRHVQWTGRLADDQGRCWLIERDDALLGFAHTAPTADPGLGPDVAELYALYLLPDATGRGWGRRLTTRALEDLRARGFTEVVLWVAVENLRAIRFYVAAGFAADPGIDVLPFGATGLTKQRMRRRLT